MSVRVVARVRPLLKSEHADDSIVEVCEAHGPNPEKRPSIVKIPNPKNTSENFSFQFNSVYDQHASQQEIFDAEVTPTIKHLFLGYDVTLFAYGSTGTGKTYTMRGGKSLVDRGMIPRLLSSIYRRSRKIEKDSDGSTTVEVSMSYYEIYNDRVYDLFEAPEKRTATGLPLRESANGKTVVVGLMEIPCGTLKDFESSYDKANSNRSTSATKLNAHSSRSHAILCVKLTVTSPTETRISTASAIDLAGSEDNRRTGNDKERMVESASINKSLFVLAQCVEAISKKHQRIPYRESKMTRILSLGQNNGFTVMILNLTPIKSYHLDTLSSLNVANRTKKIEVREVENEPVFKGPPRAVPGVSTVTGTNIHRQPLRPLNSAININIGTSHASTKNGAEKPPKAFSVYSDRTTARNSNSHPANNASLKSSPLKRPASFVLDSTRPSKVHHPTHSFIPRAPNHPSAITTATIELLVEQKVSEILATRKSNEAPPPTEASTKAISEEVQRRLDSIEQRLEGQEGARAEGLSYLLMAKQHQVRGEDGSALRMYRLAQGYFPDNEKLERRTRKLEEKLGEKKRLNEIQRTEEPVGKVSRSLKPKRAASDEADESYYAQDSEAVDSEDDEPRGRVTARSSREAKPCTSDNFEDTAITTPRTKHLLQVINTRDVSQINLLKGVGPKRAEHIVSSLEDWESGAISSLTQLAQLKGVGRKVLQGMRDGVVV